MVPEMFELVFENPCPVNTPVGVAEFFKQAGLVGSTVAGVHAEQPAEAFDGVTGVALESTPCFFTDFIDGFIESFNQMEAVDDESGVRAVVLDRFVGGPYSLGSTSPSGCAVAAMANTTPPQGNADSVGCAWQVGR